MRAAPSSETVSIREALALLGLDASADHAAALDAFRAAVKAARPDRPGGDEERFRRVIAAWRLVQHARAGRLALAAPRKRPAPTPVVAISPREALTGAAVAVGLGTRRLNIYVPPGLRTGEHLRLRRAGADGSDLYLPVLIRPADGLSVLGDDLFMTAPAPRRTLADGGRVEIDTHAGPRSAWVGPGLCSPIRLRLKDLGLPARGSRRTGHLFVTLEAVDDMPSAAEDLLARFSRVWTTERLAA